MDEPKTLAPATNPDVGLPAEPSQLDGPHTTPTVKTRIAGSALVPDLSVHQVGVMRQYRYWVGITPSCPCNGIDLAGINFPKVNEKLVRDPLRTGFKRRVPVIGALVWLTESKIRRMQTSLPRTVIRFLDDKAVQHEPGTGLNVGDNHVRPRRGQLITIPTPEEVQHRKDNRRATREYVAHINDVPAARFMFAQLCANQKEGSRGEFYPETLEKTGLVWPEELEIADILT